jgi:hypothetical protein
MPVILIQHQEYKAQLCNKASLCTPGKVSPGKVSPGKVSHGKISSDSLFTIQYKVR